MNLGFFLGHRSFSAGTLQTWFGQMGLSIGRGKRERVEETDGEEGGGK